MAQNRSSQSIWCAPRQQRLCFIILHAALQHQQGEMDKNGPNEVSIPVLQVNVVSNSFKTPTSRVICKLRPLLTMDTNVSAQQPRKRVRQKTRMIYIWIDLHEVVSISLSVALNFFRSQENRAGSIQLRCETPYIMRLPAPITLSLFAQRIPLALRVRYDRRRVWVQFGRTM